MAKIASNLLSSYSSAEANTSRFAYSQKQFWKDIHILYAIDILDIKGAKIRCIKLFDIVV